jgi:3D (Asp-Asp-Asp) domain-containing protein
MNLISKEAAVNQVGQRRITKGLSSGLFIVALVTGAYSAGNGMGPVAADNSLKSKVSSGQADSEETAGTAGKQINSSDQNTPKVILTSTSSGAAASESEIEEREFFATAYSLSGPTASGSFTKRGIIAADPRVLPLGTVVQIRAGSYSGTYRVMDTGGRIRGRKIDIFVPDRREAMHFGRRSVKVKVLGRGAAAKAKYLADNSPATEAEALASSR